jgi:hypothetical protein
MSAGQITSVELRFRSPLIAASLAAAFVVGATTASLVPSLLSGGRPTVAVHPATITPAAGTDMGAAVYDYLHPATITPAAGTDMGAAVYEYLHPDQ